MENDIELNFSNHYLLYDLILRFGLVNTLNTYSRLYIRFVRVGIFSFKCVLIRFAIPNLSLIYLIYQKSWKLVFKTVFFYYKPFLFVGVCCEIHKISFWYKKTFHIYDFTFFFIKKVDLYIKNLIQLLWTFIKKDGLITINLYVLTMHIKYIDK